MKESEAEVLNLKKTTLGRYEYCGGFGANWKSFESGIQIGDMRVINQVPHYAYMIHKHLFLKDEISWSRTDGKQGMEK